jgi:hypothetical protein
MTARISRGRSGYSKALNTDGVMPREAGASSNRKPVSKIPASAITGSSAFADDDSLFLVVDLARIEGLLTVAKFKPHRAFLAERHRAVEA